MHAPLSPLQLKLPVGVVLAVPASWIQQPWPGHYDGLAHFAYGLCFRAQAREQLPGHIGLSQLPSLAGQRRRAPEQTI
ncbi:hypothetical protein FNU76_06485 [Chitinimonas arctica]|uniref:Uncharacterized protein n=1 Tax=Chitinimonas arctica TaxID=2594795 RepID=A0A516SCZ9_9NEIS|nr:hypothetical protein [Chitinimonas arctica]QDQ26025.1 hypothetical protein FNU76_06485 [Chitinimonas arctica]